MAAYLETHGGRLGEIEADDLRDLIAEYTDTWVAEAVRELVRSGHASPTLKLITAVVERWRAEGFKSPLRWARGAGAGGNGNFKDPLGHIQDWTGVAARAEAEAESQGKKGHAPEGLAQGGGE